MKIIIAKMKYAAIFFTFIFILDEWVKEMMSKGRIGSQGEGKTTRLAKRGHDEAN